MTRYIIVIGPNLEDLAKRVSEHLVAGWVCTGGVGTCHSAGAGYMQAMVS